MNGIAYEGRLVETVTFSDCSAGLGIKIIGGRDEEEDQEFGIFVKQVLPGGLAQEDGRIQVGDQLLEVNGEKLEYVTNEEAVAILRKASSSNYFRLVITRDEAARQEYMDLLDHHGYYSSSSACEPSTSRSTTPSIHAHGNCWSDQHSPLSSGSSTPSQTHSAPIYSSTNQLGTGTQVSGESESEVGGPVSFACIPPDVLTSQHGSGAKITSPPLLHHPEPLHPSLTQPFQHQNFLMVPTLASTPHNGSSGSHQDMKGRGSLGVGTPIMGSEPSPVVPSTESPIPHGVGNSPDYSSSSQGSSDPSSRVLGQKLPDLDPHVRLRLEKLETALKYLSLDPTPEQRAELKRRLHVDEEGTITYGEFVAVARDIFKKQLHASAISPGPMYNSHTSLLDFTHPPAFSVQEGNVAPLDSVELLRRERDDLAREVERLKIELREKDKSCTLAENELLRVRKETQGAIKESRSLRSKVHLAEAAHRKSRSMEKDYEEVVRLLEAEVSQLRSSQAKHLEHPAVRKRMAVLSCQLKKTEQAKKTYEVATEKLLQFAESVYENLSGGEGPASRPVSARGDGLRGPQPPGYRSKQKRLSSQSLAQEARNVIKTVKNLVEVEPLPFGWDEAYTEDGMKYYMNHVTQVTTWTHPLSSVQRTSPSNTPRERPQSATNHTVRAIIHEPRS